MSSVDEFTPTSETHEEPLHNLVTMFETVPSHHVGERDEWEADGCIATIVPVEPTENIQTMWLEAGADDYLELEEMR